MRVVNFIEVTKDDGSKARVHADSIEVVSATKEGLTICTTRVTLKVINDDLDSLWEKIKCARGGLESRVFGDEHVPRDKRFVPKPKPGPKPKQAAA